MVEELGLGRPRVDPDLVLRLQKYRRPDAAPPAVREVARRMAALAESLVEPAAWVWRGPVREAEPGGSVAIGAGLRFQSQALARALAGAAEAAIVVMTIGPGLEERAQALIGEEQLVEGLLLDTAGWAALDAMIKDVRGRLAAEARARGLRLTARLAPGFADWRLEEQGTLFSAFDGAPLVVTLTDAQVMLPRKSVSALFGLVPQEARHGA
jgi:hypothetical protein